MIELFSEEPMESSRVFQRSLAGDSFNILVAAGRLGTSTGYITLLGDDPFQTYLRNSFTDEGIDISQIKTIPGFNAAHFVATKDDGDPGTGDDGGLDTIAVADVYFFESLSLLGVIFSYHIV